MTPRRLFMATLLAASFAASAHPLEGKQARLIVSFAPGGTADILARGIATAITRKTGVPVIVDNRPGAGGAIATEAVARANPDGLTLLLHSTGIVIAPYLQKSVSYKLLTDLTTVTPVASGPFVLLKSPQLPVKDIGEFLAYARANPGKLNFGTGGAGSTAHLTGEKLKFDAGIDIVHIPFKGGSPAMAAVMANDVQFSFEPIASARPLTDGRKLVPLAVTSRERSKLWSELPSLAEAGVPGFDISIWYAVFLPARTPDDIKKFWNDTLAALMKDSQIAFWIDGLGLDPMSMSLPASQAFMQAETLKWGSVIQRANIAAE